MSSKDVADATHLDAPLFEGEAKFTLVGSLKGLSVSAAC